MAEMLHNQQYVQKVCGAFKVLGNPKCFLSCCQKCSLLNKLHIPFTIYEIQSGGMIEELCFEIIA